MFLRLKKRILSFLTLFVSVAGTFRKMLLFTLSLIVANRKLIYDPIFLVYLNAPCHSFEGVGECSKLLTDFAFLLKKSMYLPEALKGNCVIKSEKDFPKVLKSAGYHYKESNNVITLSEIISPAPKVWHAPLKRYLVNFAFLNKSSFFDCGLKANDVLASLDNLKFSFSVGESQLRAYISKRHTTKH